MVVKFGAAKCKSIKVLCSTVGNHCWKRHQWASPWRCIKTQSIVFFVPIQRLVTDLPRKWKQVISITPRLMLMKTNESNIIWLREISKGKVSQVKVRKLGSLSLCALGTELKILYMRKVWYLLRLINTKVICSPLEIAAAVCSLSRTVLGSLSPVFRDQNRFQNTVQPMKIVNLQQYTIGI